MATKKLTFNIALEQNKNLESTAYGKWYGKTYSPNEALNLKGLIQRVAMDQSVFSEDIARGVIDRLTVTMVELLQSGTSVKWDQLGTFRPTVESVGITDPLDYNVNTDVKGIHIRFIPENAKGEEITSRQFADLCTLMTAGVWTVEKVTIGGKQKSVRRFRPMASFKDQGGHPAIPAIVPVLLQLSHLGNAIKPNPDGKYYLSQAAIGAAKIDFAGRPSAGVYTALIGEQTLGASQQYSETPITTAKGWISWTGKTVETGNYDLFIQYPKPGEPESMVQQKVADVVVTI